jgi:hypothetical protein
VIVATDGAASTTKPLSKSAKLALKQLQDSSHLERERRRVNTFRAMLRTSSGVHFVLLEQPDDF